MNYTEIATAFSNGAFSTVYTYLHDNIVWHVIGESVYTGKAAVMAQCEQTAAYFQSVTTIFTTETTITDDRKVAVSGTAEFIRDQQRIAYVKACDLYFFDEEGKLVSIHSYCIPEKK